MAHAKTGSDEDASSRDTAVGSFTMARFGATAIQVGLQFNITPAMRFIYVDLRGQTIRLTAYFERDPTEEEREMLLDAAVEAGAQAKVLLEFDVRCIRDDRLFHLIQSEGGSSTLDAKRSCRPTSDNPFELEKDDVSEDIRARIRSLALHSGARANAGTGAPRPMWR